MLVRELCVWEVEGFENVTVEFESKFEGGLSVGERECTNEVGAVEGVELGLRPENHELERDVLGVDWML